MAINCILLFKVNLIEKHSFRYGQLLHYRCFIQLELGSEDF